MFTMSLPPELNRLAKEALIEPVRVDLAPATRPGTGIRQVIYPVLRDLKPDFLNHMLSDRELWGGSEVRSMVLFTRTRYGAEGLARQLHRRNYVTAVLDDYPSQQEREQALEELRRGRMQILVASDGAGPQPRPVGHRRTSSTTTSRRRPRTTRTGWAGPAGPTRRATCSRS